MLHEHATSLSAASHANRSRRPNNVRKILDTTQARRIPSAIDSNSAAKFRLPNKQCRALRNLHFDLTQHHDLLRTENSSSAFPSPFPSSSSPTKLGPRNAGRVSGLYRQDGVSARNMRLRSRTLPTNIEERKDAANTISHTAAANLISLLKRVVFLATPSARKGPLNGCPNKIFWRLTIVLH